MNSLHPAEYRFTFAVRNDWQDLSVDVIAPSLEDAYAKVLGQYGPAQLSCVDAV